MIKMYAFDLDGTLLNSDQRMDKVTAELLRKMKADGRKIVIATGRAKGVMENILTENNLDCDLILNNGHEVIVKGRGIKYVPFSWELLRDVLRILKKYDMHLTALGADEQKYSFYEKEFYYQKHIDMTKSIHTGKELDMTLPLYNKDAFTKNFNCIEDVDGYEDVRILKIDAKTLDNKVKAKCLKELEKIPGLMLSSSYEFYIEIIQDNADKGKALIELAESYGIKPEEIAAFGDGVNDIEMLSSVKYSCAMGNSFNCVKEHAAYVTDTNNNQGVYKQLLKFLEIK